MQLIALIDAEFNGEFKNAIDSFVVTRKTKVITLLAMVDRQISIIRKYKSCKTNIVKLIPRMHLICKLFI